MDYDDLNYILLCNNCKNIPYVKYFRIDNAEKIKIKCSCTSHSFRIIGLSQMMSDYIFNLEDVIKERNPTFLKEFNCYQHRNTPIYGYCTECQENVCYQCYHKHCSTDRIKPKKLNQFLTEEDYIKRLAIYFKVKDLYNKFQKNSEILKFVGILFHNYNYFKNNSNYAIISNLLNNTRFEPFGSTRIIKPSFIDCIHTINDNRDQVMFVLPMQTTNKIVSCSKDKTVKVYSQTDFICLHTFQLTTYAQNILQYDEKVVLTFSHQGNVTILDVDNYKIIKEGILKYLGQFIDVILYDKSTVVFSSYDHCISLWNISTFQCITRVTVYKEDYIRGLLKIKKGMIVTCGEKSILSFWNPKPLVCERIMKRIELSSSKAIIELSNGEIAIGSRNVIKIVNPYTYHITKIIQAYFGMVLFLIQKSENTLITVLDNYDMKQIDLTFNVIDSIVDSHDNKISSISLLCKDRIVTSSLDTKIKVWI